VFAIEEHRHAGQRHGFLGGEISASVAWESEQHGRKSKNLFGYACGGRQKDKNYWDDCGEGCCRWRMKTRRESLIRGVRKAKNVACLEADTLSDFVLLCAVNGGRVRESMGAGLGCDPGLNWWSSRRCVKQFRVGTWWEGPGRRVWIALAFRSGDAFCSLQFVVW